MISPSILIRLGNYGFLNQIVDDSNSDSNNFECQFQSDWNLTTKIGFQLKDNVNFQLKWTKFQLNLTKFNLFLIQRFKKPTLMSIKRLKKLIKGSKMVKLYQKS